MKKTALFPILSLLGLVSSLGADFGLHFIVDQVQPQALQSPQSRLSLRFTAPADLNARALAVHCHQAQNAPAYLVGLYADRGGRPHGKALAQESVVPKAGSWSLLSLAEESAPLVAGRTYHLLIQWDALRGGKHPVGTIDENHWASFTLTGPNNLHYPKDGAANPASQALLDTGKGFRALDLQPVFTVAGQGQSALGNPYTRPAPLSIHGNATPDRPEDDLWESQALHFHCGQNSQTLQIRARKVGAPAHPLTLAIYQHDYMHHIVRERTRFQVDTGALGARWSWLEVPLRDDQGNALSFSPDCQYLAFHSRSGASDNKAGCRDCWQISGASGDDGLSGSQDLTFDGGSHQSRAAGRRGEDGAWVDRFNADAHVRVLARDCGQPGDAVTPIPTPAQIHGGAH